jgi:hypothetical protein
MSSPAPVAFALVRVPRGQPRPPHDEFQAVIRRDRERLHLAPADGPIEIEVTGPVQVVVNGAEYDEYSVWER